MGCFDNSFANALRISISSQALVTCREIGGDIIGPRVCVSLGMVQSVIPKRFSKYKGIPAIRRSSLKYPRIRTAPHTALSHQDRETGEPCGEMSTSASQAESSLSSRYRRLPPVPF